MQEESNSNLSEFYKIMKGLNLSKIKDYLMTVHEENEESLKPGPASQEAS